MAIEAIAKKISDSEVKLPMDNPVVADALRRGDIQGLHKLLTDYGLSIGDFEQFAASQHSKYINHVVQAEPLYEGYAMAPPPQMESFPQFDMSNSFSPEDSKMAAEMIVSKAMSATGKAATKGADGKAQVKAGMKPDMSGIQGHVDDAMEEVDNLNDIIMEAQFVQELSNKSAELENELQKIMAMAKSGQIEDPSIIILALAKVQVEKYGLVFSQLGKKVMRISEESKTAYNALQNDPSIKQQYAFKQKDQEFSRGMTDKINQMNQVTQYISSVVTSAKSSMDAYNSLRSEMVRKLDPR